MTYAVHDFAAINRRLNRKPEPVGLMPIELTPEQQAVADLRASLDETERAILHAIETGEFNALWAGC